MDTGIDRYLDEIGRHGISDRRNGSYRRHLLFGLEALDRLPELGEIEFSVPRTRRYSAVEVVKAYARRTKAWRG